MKEGYLQIKIGEVEEKLLEAENKINSLFSMLNEKEKKIQKFLVDIELTIKDCDATLKKYEEMIDIINGKTIEAKSYNEKIFRRAEKTMLRESEKMRDKLTNALNDRISRFMAFPILLSNYLLEKGITSNPEFINYLSKNYDKITKTLLEKPSDEMKKMYDTITNFYGIKE